jgi:NTE family protein
MGVGDEADLASYLLFDGAFCKQLIELGRADAKARKDDLLAFFGDRGEDGGTLLEGDEVSGAWSGTSMVVPPIGT